jgi:hypothetical protein
VASVLFLYGRPGCGLCAEARGAVDEILAARRRAGLSVPDVVERDITTDPAWERDFHLTIPVLELGRERIHAVTSSPRIRDFIAAALDGVPLPSDARPSC